MNNEKRIIDLNLGDKVNRIFYIKETEFRLRRDGRTIDGFLKISDGTGEIEAIYWDMPPSKVKQLEKMQFAQIDGQASRKRKDGELQINIKSITEGQKSLLQLEDFIPSTPFDIAELMEKIDGKISSIKNQYLRSLLLSFFQDPILRGIFRIAPAAKKLHQAYQGGLAEHTLNVAEICEKICELYPQINRDFLISTALLHDIGKLEEYQFEGVIEYTDKGKLIGHVVMGAEMVDAKIKMIKGFPEDLAIMFKHTILSHHGKLEFGSPKLPSILPAVALYYADDTDAKLNGLIGLKEQNKNIDKKWSEWVWWLERSFYLAEQDILDPNREELTD